MLLSLPLRWIFYILFCPIIWFFNRFVINTEYLLNQSRKSHPSFSENETDSPYFKNRCSRINTLDNPDGKSTKLETWGRRSNKLISKGRAKNLNVISIKSPSLIDIGANPYLNSALLGISCCSKFVLDIKAIRQKYKTGLEKLSIFNELLSILIGSSTSRKRITQNRIFKNWNKLCQQDSFELLEHVLNQVYNEIRKYKIDKGDISIKYIREWLRVPLPLRIVLEYRIYCQCDSPMQVFLQSDLAIHLEIPLKDNKEIKMQNLIDNFFMEDPIMEYICIKDGCDGKNAIRYTRIHKPLPHTICVHLQRIYWNGFQNDKIKRKVSFEKRLIIKSEYCLQKNIIRINSQDPAIETKPDNYQKRKNSVNNLNEEVYSKMFDSFVNCNEKTNDFNGIYDEGIPKEHSNISNKIDNHLFECDEVFDLISILVHHGPVNGGHYDCYKYYNNKWFLIDDYQIIEVDEQEVFNCQAYVLFYEKINY